MNNIEKILEPSKFPVSSKKFHVKDVMRRKIHCPVCHSEKVIVEKGNGAEIIGADFVGIWCIDCQKKYLFDDVKYKQSK